MEISLLTDVGQSVQITKIMPPFFVNRAGKPDHLADGGRSTELKHCQREMAALYSSGAACEVARKRTALCA